MRAFWLALLPGCPVLAVWLLLAVPPWARRSARSPKKWVARLLVTLPCSRSSRSRTFLRVPARLRLWLLLALLVWVELLVWLAKKLLRL